MAPLRWRWSPWRVRLPGVRSRRSRRRPINVPCPASGGNRFPPDVILLAVRWYLRFGISYRDVEELLAERGVDVEPRDDLPIAGPFVTSGTKQR